jgi:hypothetical protein
MDSSKGGVIGGVIGREVQERNESLDKRSEAASENLFRNGDNQVS